LNKALFPGPCDRAAASPPAAPTASGPLEAGDCATAPPSGYRSAGGQPRGSAAAPCRGSAEAGPPPPGRR
jgi:hypothetical protein